MKILNYIDLLGKGTGGFVKTSAMLHLFPVAAEIRKEPNI